MSGSQESLTFEDVPTVNPIISTDQKRCTKCRTVKRVSEFYKNKRYRDGSEYWCKECRKKASSVWYRANAEMVIGNNLKRQAENPKKKIEDIRRWQANNPEKVLNWVRRWQAKNPERVKAASKRYYQTHGKLPMARLNSNISQQMRRYLKGNKGGVHWEKLVGFTIKQLKDCLERQFIKGMTWENYGEWHVDHKIPISAFHFTSPDHTDFKKCWSLKNLQPMWAKENITKSNKLDGDFQPSLLI